MIKEKTKTSKIYRGSALAFAAAFVVAGLPAISIDNASYATGESFSGSIYLLQAETEAKVGENYEIRTAYFDSTANAIGLDSDANSTVTVTYVSTGENVSITKDSDTNINDELTAFGTDKDATKLTYGSFAVTALGDYKITYSYTDAGSNKYTKEMTVTATKSDAVVSLANSDVVLPKIYDLGYSKVKDGDVYKKINLPAPSVYVDGADEASSVNIYTASETVPASETNYVRVSVTGPKTVTIQKDGSKLFINGSELVDGIGEYSVKYEYYQKKAGVDEIGQYIASTSASFTVKNGYYYSDYAITATNGVKMSFVTGVESNIATPVVSASFYKSESDKTDENKTTESLEEKDDINYFSYKAIVKFWNGSAWEETTNKVVDGKYTPAKDGDYKVIYTVTDFYGNTAELSVNVNDVKDTEDPEVFMYDASNAANYTDNDLTKGISSYIQEDYKLKSKTTVSNVVIYAIGATDNVTSLDKMTLKRTITNNNSSTLTITEYNNYNLIFNYSYALFRDGSDLLARSAAAAEKATEADANAWLKANKYLKVVTNYLDASCASCLEGLETDKTKEGFDLSAIKARLVENGFAYISSTVSIVASRTYSVVYSAKDESKETNTTTSDTYSFTTISDEDALTLASTPTISIDTKFKSSYKLSDKKISFNAPVATDDNDTRMKTVVSYQFYNGTTPLTEYTIGEDDEYAIDLTKAPAEANKVVLTASVTNDYGADATYTKELTLADLADNDVPTISAEVNPITGTHEQYTEFTLPNVTFTDDFCASVSGTLTIYKVNGDSKSVVSYAGATDKIVKSAKTYTLIGGEFTPMDAGTYELVYEVEDPANNIVSVYYFFNVTGVAVTPEVSVGAISAINGDNTVTVGEEFEFEVPTLNVNGGTVVAAYYADATLKTASDFSIDYIGGPALPVRVNETIYKVTKAGTYKFQYSVRYKLDGGSEQEVTSDVFTITASATTESKYYNINFGSKGVYNETEKLNTTISIYSVGGDENIDTTKSTISISCSGPTTGYQQFKLSEFVTGTEGYDATSKSISYKLVNNGSYTIKYNIVDSNGNSYVPANGSSSYTIKVGDYKKPEIEFDTEFIETEYNLNDELTLDLSKITLSDNDDKSDATREQLLSNLKITLERKDDDGNYIEVENAGDTEQKIYKYSLENSGEYRLTVYTKDATGWSNSAEKTFTVSTEGKEAEKVSTKTIGIILIVLACLILGGVIAYFVISRIKMNKKAKLAPKADKTKNKK